MHITTVSEVMTGDVYAFAQDTTIETAARALVNRHMTGAPVVADSGRPVGVVTIADLLDPDRPRVLPDGYPLFYRMTEDDLQDPGDDLAVTQGLVADVMSPFVLSIESSATLVEAANRMISEQVHRLLVMDDTRLVGIVSSIDLLRGFVVQKGS